ncbi:SRPBCC family protein [Leucobacter luti]|uniref:Activator of Hsp90 ATPase-like protein n=1 Tax=Leucobacter luti TaxID=340320 RepID=A0A4Q7TYY5_9MICO|nr:SRPBCC domain-containing protein [Leucobacter luti]RZT66335.1 activator of Hsp90 ATPase-like protein [Leucobacter luti]
MIPLGPVVARSRLRAARTAAWAFLANSDYRAQWWPELRLEPQVGGEISERWTEDTEEESVSRDASGTVDVWVEGHAIGFTWREAGDLRDTAVLLTLRSQGAETGITVTETGFDALPDSAERAAASQDGWQVLLRDLSGAIDRAVEDGWLEAVPVAAAASDAAPTDSVSPAQEEGADVADAGAEADAADEADQAGAAGAEDADDAGVADADAAAPLDADTAPIHAVTVATEPADAESPDAELSDPEPGEAAPGDAEPGDAEPADAESTDTEPGDAEPTDAEAAGAEPEEAAAESSPTGDPDFDALIRGDFAEPDRRD